MNFNPIYSELGVRTIIHAGGTKTTHGGSRVHPSVFDAMKIASESFVDIVELNRKIGEYIAEITGAEAGMITSGAASGVVLSIAACMTGTDISKIRQLPKSDGMKNEVVIQRIHRGGYSHMYTFTGATIVDVGDVNDCLPEELAHAITSQTAAIAYLIGPRVSRTGLTLPEVVAIAHDRGVPVIVDAAAMLPPKSNLQRYVEEGADLIVFSGGKLIGGPQNTGIMFGRRDLIEAALANTSPNHAIGRPHKVSKEDMVGLYAALQIYINSDESERIEHYKSLLEPIYKSLKDIDKINVTIQHDDHNHHVPTLVIEFSTTWNGRSPYQIKEGLLSGDPGIFVQYFKDIGHLVVNPINVQDDEQYIIADKLREQLLH
ncbi:aminotransferase class V-fold PLP-dependent enzyme [Alicyclobacillus sp. SO9]|uniref:aminotransferase class V-fold PLP-dependent enzyme n=1 Tax=Alicyclobacillus sp. SO9 TaxID=2665646 RepID=UPI0018E89B32|nr:aminotransferase class V-fold PLP-dependent enzyme [Alicyclobacillus sp. SO9]QQE79732.1 aminotransferase class V-fold PLP-dependent enzyme [Alicyclobacillus sp. SO9]